MNMHWIGLLGGSLLVAAHSDVVSASCSANNTGQITLGSGVATTPTSDTSWNQNGKSYTYMAQGMSFYVVDNANQTKWTSPVLTSSIQNFISPVSPKC